MLGISVANGFPTGVASQTISRRALRCSFLTAGAASLIALTLFLPSRNAVAAEPGEMISASNEYSVTLPLSERTRNNGETAASQEARRLTTHPSLKGWDHLYSLMVDQGADPDALIRVFSDPRMPRRETLYFSLTPRESHSLYRKHNSAVARRNALRFYEQNSEWFIRAEKDFGVPQSMILSLLQIETSCGAFTGNDRVFPRLARLAAAAAPDNINANYQQKKRRLKLLSVDNVRKRANILQDLFLTHTAATVGVARNMGLHPLELRGSSAGAIGLPQFLPGNVRRFGRDANRDGSVDLFTAPDAIYSVGSFLSSHGWNHNNPPSTSEMREILYHYNRSEPYVSTAIALSRALEKDLRRSSAEKGK